MSVQQFETPAGLQDALNEASSLKSIITDAVEEGFQSAVSAMKQGRRAAEDALDDAKLAARKNPIQTMGVVLGVGVCMGALMMWLGSRRG